MQVTANALCEGKNVGPVVSPTMYKGAVLLDNDILDTTRMFYPQQAPSLDDIMNNFGEMYEAIATRYGSKLADRMLTRAVSRTVGYPIDKINSKKMTLGVGKADRMMGLDRDLLAVLPIRYVHEYTDSTGVGIRGLEETKLYGKTASISNKNVEKIDLKGIASLDYTPTNYGFLVPTVLIDGKVQGKESSGVVDYPLVRVPEEVFFEMFDRIERQAMSTDYHPEDRDIVSTQIVRLQDAIDKISTGVVDEKSYTYWAESYLSALASLTETDLNKTQGQLSIGGIRANSPTLQEIYSVYFPGKVLIKQTSEGTTIKSRNGETLSPEMNYAQDNGQGGQN